jgi:glycosyltransferase involved in cell wall biosynthesis
MVPDLGLIAFPWCPSLETGRGHDTYSFHLFSYIFGTDLQSKVFPIIPMERLQQGVNRFDYFSKEVLFFFKALFQNCKIYHGISHIGGKTAVLAGRKPLVCTIHDAIPFIHYRDARQAYERLCIKICCLGCDEIIVSSQFTRKFLEKQVGLDPSKVTVIKYGVDHGHFSPKLKDAGQKKRVFSIVRWGNAEQILLAFQKIKRAVPASSFSLGLTSSFETKCRGKIVNLVKKMGLEDCTRLLYNIPMNELPGLYRGADVYVSPSLGGFSLTLLESMSCGTPVVAFDLLDVPEYVGDAGLLVAPNDYDSLADSVVDVLINEKLRRSLSRRSLDRSEAYSWQRMGFETVEVYRKLLS